MRTSFTNAAVVPQKPRDLNPGWDGVDGWSDDSEFQRCSGLPVLKCVLQFP